jgi:hypothetical protein
VERSATLGHIQIVFFASRRAALSHFFGMNHLHAIAQGLLRADVKLKWKESHC